MIEIWRIWALKGEYNLQRFIHPEPSFFSTLESFQAWNFMISLETAQIVRVTPPPLQDYPLGVSLKLNRLHVAMCSSDSSGGGDATWLVMRVYKRHIFLNQYINLWHDTSKLILTAVSMEESRSRQSKVCVLFHRFRPHRRTTSGFNYN